VLSTAPRVCIALVVCCHGRRYHPPVTRVVPGTAVCRRPVSSYLTALSAVAAVTASSPPHPTQQSGARIRTIYWYHMFES